MKLSSIVNLPVRVSDSNIFVFIFLTGGFGRLYTQFRMGVL